jgi:T4 RnlA family RNA ligase
MLNVQRHIFENGLDSLQKEPLNLLINEYDNGLVVINYDQINSPKHHPLTKECRGLILDARNNYSVVSRSFDRFFNYGECPETNHRKIINSLLMEKIDGSLIAVYFHDGEWNVATRKMAYAEGLTAFGNTYRQVFDKAFDIDKIKHFNENLTFVFELVSPETRIVTPYTQYDVYLLTVRQNSNGEEYTSAIVEQIAKDLNIKTPMYYRMTNYDEVQQAIKQLKPFEEGYVALWEDDGKHRIKIKNPGYLAIAHLRQDGNLSEKRMVTLILTGEVEEYFIYFKEDRPFFQPYMDAHQRMLDEVNKLWNKYKGEEIQKNFALGVKDSPVAPILFGLRKGNTVQNTLDKMSEDIKLRIIKAYKK